MQKITTGLFAGIIGKISALTILQYVDFVNNKPIGRIKIRTNLIPPTGISPFFHYSGVKSSIHRLPTAIWTYVDIII